MTKLKALVGRELTSVETVHDYHQFRFGDYCLNVFNPFDVAPTIVLAVQRPRVVW